jgi:protein-disulfide isomerase
MSQLLRVILAALLLTAAPLVVRADEGDYPIMADDGTMVANHRIPAELEGRIELLPDVVVAANPNGKVTLFEFYDLNCPYCRKASTDIDELVRSNPELRLVLVPFAVLGIPSILAARVEYAVARLASPQKFYEFHHLAYAGRGVVDDRRAFEAAKTIGLDMAKVRQIANEDSFGSVMTAHVRLGDALGIQATPGFVIKGVAIVGYPGKAALQKIIASVERCNAVVCQGAPG